MLSGKTRHSFYPIIFMILLVANGCLSHFYFSTMAMIGYEKRDLLIDAIKTVIANQKETRENFKTALQRFSEVTDFEEGEDLEEKYFLLLEQYEASEESAREMHNHIEEVEDTSEALFDEWEDELDLYKDRQFRKLRPRPSLYWRLFTIESFT